jgi:AcrR family transcriptional regulator
MLFQAFQELLGEKGFDQISVQDIAERSTLNRATFYDHFPDKFALLEAMIGERLGKAVEARMDHEAPTCEKSLRSLILAVCDFHTDLLAGCDSHRRQFEPIAESCVRNILSQSILRDLEARGAKNPGLKATMVSWAITGAALQGVREKKMSSEELADAVLPTILTALEAGD